MVDRPPDDSDPPPAGRPTDHDADPASSGRTSATPSATPSDRLAVILGNASLLGVGHLLMRRWRAAAGTIATTAVLVLMLAAFGQPGWFWRVMLALWWLVTIGHGWVATRRPTTPTPAGGATADARPGGVPVPADPAPLAGPSRDGAPVPVLRQRLVGAASAAVVLTGVVVVAADTRRIEAAAADAHTANECPEAVETLDRLGVAHRVVDPYVASRADASAEACDLLTGALAEADDDPEAAAQTLGEYAAHPSARWPGATELQAELLIAAAGVALEHSLSSGLTTSLAHGFTLLTEAVELAPDRAGEVTEILATHLDQLPDLDPCDARAHLDWLRERTPADNALDQSIAAAQALAPPATLACGDQFMAEERHPDALRVYEVIVSTYPDHEVADSARDGVEEAETRIEEQRVRDLLDQGRYCDQPAPYRGAPAYDGSGPHAVLVDRGPSLLHDAIPAGWEADDVTDATLVLCGGEVRDGRDVGTCQYEGGIDVTLRGHQLTVTGYELRTGEEVFEVEANAAGDCPPVITYYGSPPSEIRADDPRASSVESALRPFISP